MKTKKLKAPIMAALMALSLVSLNACSSPTTPPPAGEAGSSVVVDSSFDLKTADPHANLKPRAPLSPTHCTKRSSPLTVTT